MTNTLKLIFIFLITLITLVIDMPRQLQIGPLHLTSPYYRPLKKGLDLQGGMQVTLEVDMHDIAPQDRQDAFLSARNIIARRVNLYGVSEAVVNTLQTNNSYRLLVSLPGLTNYKDALTLIGTTAQLDFREPPQGTTSANIFQYQKTDLTGKDLAKATLTFDDKTSKPAVALTFTKEGAKKFAHLTARNINKPLAIFLDSLPISAPIVQQQITDGHAVISGNFTLSQAKNLVVSLNAGALPAPIHILQQTNIPPSLGTTSVHRSLQAGVVGLLAVVLFMIFLYGWLGFIADLGLVIYGLITLALYKLIPVTLTLPGLAGFLLSIGMAVDANILIFERMKEELRKGYSWQVALERGFDKAWDSIKDANVATLIITFILFNPLDWPFLNTSGMIRGFALTLFLGIIVSLFTGIFVTRTFLRSFYVSKN